MKNAIKLRIFDSLKVLSWADSFDKFQNNKIKNHLDDLFALLRVIPNLLDRDFLAFETMGAVLNRIETYINVCGVRDSYMMSKLRI